jgi:predicted transcriptional regulator of viral defense system
MRPARSDSQQTKATALLQRKGMVRLSEFRDAGITAAAISRLERSGSITRLARGLYQLPNASIDANHSLAEAAKLVPKGVICLASALAFHGLVDEIPASVWIAIGPKAWRPKVNYPPVRFVRFPPKHLRHGVDQHQVEGIAVPIFSAAKTIADAFRYRKIIGTNIVVSGLREALRQGKTTAGEISKYAIDGGVWKVMEPYMSALARD